MAGKYSKIYLPDDGTALDVDAKADIRSAISVHLEVKGPKGNEYTLPAAVYGKTMVRRVIKKGDFPTSGLYLIMSAVEFKYGSWLGRTTRLHIHPKFG
jgi:hypothetical protein